jgi:hypothetical protein
VRHRFAYSPGESVENWFWYNLGFWTDLRNYFKFDRLFSPWLLAPRGANVLILLFLAIPLRFGWPHLRSDLRWAFGGIAAVLLPLFIRSGLGDEVRGLALLVPFLLITVTLGARALSASTDGQRTMAVGLLEGREPSSRADTCAAEGPSPPN